MSYLDADKERFNWTAAPSGVSVHRAPGCVQCGSRLEMTGQGIYSLSGKCMNCTDRLADDDVFVCAYDDGLED